MLDVIGAGATATSEQDWHKIWKESPEVGQLQEEIQKIHTEGRNRPLAQGKIHTGFTTRWSYQVQELFKREATSYWRDPEYLMAKLILNAFGGLFIGFTFFKASDSQQGTQNKLFVCFPISCRLYSVSNVFLFADAVHLYVYNSEVLDIHRPRLPFLIDFISVPLANQLQVPFINTRKIYEIRERPSRMYSWTALLASQMMIEIPWNIVGSSILFVTWYWTVGFDNSRAGYTYLMMGIVLPFYYTTFGQVRSSLGPIDRQSRDLIFSLKAVAAISPSAEIAALLFSFLFSFVLTLWAFLFMSMVRRFLTPF